MSDWKPGDVVEGFVLSRRRKHLLLRVDASIHDDGHWPWLLLDADTEVPLADRGIGEDNVREAHLVVSPTRPLVVIDPEDAEQVQRLARLYIERAFPLYKHLGKSSEPRIVDDLAATLREFAHPSPRIEEPTGLGAVVEDADGVRWVRWNARPDAGVAPWTQAHEGGADTLFRDLNVVRVLSEGVPA